MRKKNFPRGTVLFQAGDRADEMYYISSGQLRLVEINTLLGENDVVGEMGLFTPSRERLVTAVCEEDLETFVMGKDDLAKLFKDNPSLAFNLLEISIKRYSENLAVETAARERIESELRIAHDIQNSMLPQSFPVREEFSLFGSMEAAKDVGGDFYDFFFVPDGRFCLMIGDVSGKGVPAALFMAITKTMLKSAAHKGLSPAAILSEVNNGLCAENQMGMFVTVFCLLFDPKTGQITFCNGGHNPPLVGRTNGEFGYLEVPTGIALAAMEDMDYEDVPLTLKAGESLFLYTDGVTEAMNPDKKLYSEERLQQDLSAISSLEVDEIIPTLRAKVHAFAAEEPQSDDLTMLVLRYRGA